MQRAHGPVAPRAAPARRRRRAGQRQQGQHDGEGRRLPPYPRAHERGARGRPAGPDGGGRPRAADPHGQGRGAARHGRRARSARDRDPGRERRGRRRPAATPGTTEALLDRLALTEARIAAMADGLRHVATLPDPVGEVVRGSTPAERPGAAPGPRAARRRRHRLRGPAERHRRRRRAVPQERQRGAAARQRQRLPAATPRSSTCWRPPPPRRACPRTASSSCPAPTAVSVKELMQARGLVDVLIPRGGAGLIESVVTESTGAGHRDRRRQLHRLRRRERRPRQGGRHHRQRQDLAAERLQRRRDAARARRRRRRLPAARGRRRSRPRA